MKNNRKGFTLIEMLVVVAIIGLLASVVVVGVGGARQKARDTKRVADLRQIQTYLEANYKNGAYPAAISSVSSLPKDPSTSKSYSYCTDSETYTIGAKLENGASNKPSGAPSSSTCTLVPALDCSNADVYCVAP